ncbi:hypothetical protein J6590_049018 [Homalodisca vitripennis]|nr:hypothetical protein J6590_049018 [Homalodisca vitripennis]
MLVCLYKLVGGVLDDSALLSKLQFSVPRLNSRSRLLFSPRYSRTNLAANSPLNHLESEAVTDITAVIGGVIYGLENRKKAEETRSSK